MELLSGNREPGSELEVLTGPVLKTLEEGVRSAVEYYNNNPPDENVISARNCIASAIKEFHNKAEISNDAIESELKKFTDPSALIIEVAHQPNIFPYGNYYKKIVLGKVLGDELRKQVDVPVVVTFGFHDQDFANPKWFRRTNLPDIYSQDGILSLKLPVSRKSSKVMYAVPAPDEAQVSSWKTVMENWLTSNIRRFNKMIKTDYALLDLPEDFMINKDRSNIIRGRMRRVYELIDECQKLAGSITDFNAFFTARLVFKYWEYPILFYDYHSIESCFKNEYLRFINSEELLERYSKTFSSAYKKAAGEEITFDFNLPSADQAPFWYQCGCGGKVEVSFELPGPKFRFESCPECGESITMDFQAQGDDIIDERLSPRAAFRPLLIANTLRPSIFVSGLAAQGFHMISRGLAKELDVSLSPFIIWPGGDNYSSLGKLVAELTYAELQQKSESELTMKEKKLVQNYQNTIGTIPSIIDYLINIGLSEAAVGWEDHLQGGENLASIPNLRSIFDLK